VVLVHLGSPLPKHARICIRQVIAASGESPVVVGPAAARKLRSEGRTRFRQVESLSDMGLKRFWRYACERFFVLEAAMRAMSLERCIHIECDVLTYASPASYEGWLIDTYGAGLATCPLTDSEDTAAVMYVGSQAALSAFNTALLDLVAIPPEEFIAAHGGAMAHEMRMMNLLRTKSGLAASLPTTLDSAQETGSAYIFDPASYGQYVDGVPAEPGVSYAGEHHHAGRELLSGNYRLRWDAQQRVPLLSGDRSEYPLATLHIHSKRLDRWAWDTDPRPPASPLSRVRGELRPRFEALRRAGDFARRDA
jgi:hypothetical protein